jgi:Protein of unknown function (DUF4058)
MPLLDHFTPPLAGNRKWPAIDGPWITFIVQQLNGGVLPERYVAVPHETRGGIEIDVAALRNGRSEPGGGPPGAAWSPPPPTIAVPIDFTAAREFEVRILNPGHDRELLAAIELVSPSNKDRPAERRAFAAKCASYLHQGASVVVVDCVTEYRANLHAELVDLLGLGPAAAWDAPSGLSAISYRTSGATGRPQLHLWPVGLTIGEPLPTLPLWLDEAEAVPLDLDASYAAACRTLRLCA